MALGSILILALCRLQGPGWAPWTRNAAFHPKFHGLRSSPSQLLLLEVPPKAPNGRGCLTGQGGGLSRASPQLCLAQTLLFPLSGSNSITFPGGFGCVQDQATSVPAVHSLKSARECRATTKILFLDPNSGVFWAQSGSSALLPLFSPTISFQCSLPISSISLWVCQPG